MEIPWQEEVEFERLNTTDRGKDRSM